MRQAVCRTILVFGHAALPLCPAGIIFTLRDSAWENPYIYLLFKDSFNYKWTWKQIVYRLR
jgi:hypothetical protein